VFEKVDIKFLCGLLIGRATINNFCDSRWMMDENNENGGVNLRATTSERRARCWLPRSEGGRSSDEDKGEVQLPPLCRRNSREGGMHRTRQCCLGE
jgi:hypothetical protein